MQQNSKHLRSTVEGNGVNAHNTVHPVRYGGVLSSFVHPATVAFHFDPPTKFIGNATLNKLKEHSIHCHTCVVKFLQTA